MILVYNNGNEFISDNEDIFKAHPIETNFFKLNAKGYKKFSYDNYALKVFDGEKKLIIIRVKPYHTMVFGNAELIKEAALALYNYNLCVTSLLGGASIGNAFLKEYTELTKGSYEVTFSMDIMTLDKKCDVDDSRIERYQVTDFLEFKELINLFDAEALGENNKDTDAKLMQKMNSSYCIKENGKIVSSATETYRTDSSATISLVYTRKEYRGKGYGKQVVGHIANTATEAGLISYLYVDKTNPISNHVYSSLGYTYLEPQTEFKVIESKIKRAVFAGGCFWCLANAFADKNGIITVKSGYTGGDLVNPTYEEVKAQDTNHKEAIIIEYDSKIISYDSLLRIYFESIDPFDAGGQFIDRGSNYESVIFTSDNDEIESIEFFKKIITAKYNKEVCVKTMPLNAFYLAEEYHQDYAKKNPELFSIEEEKSGRTNFENIEITKK